MIGQRLVNGEWVPRYPISRLLVYGACMLLCIAFWVGVGMVVERCACGIR